MAFRPPSLKNCAKQSTGEHHHAKLKTDERVLARITDGIYRHPASALRELISNAYDADAANVWIETDAPRFQQIVISDDGNGMTLEALANLIEHIGGSPKRTAFASAMGVASPGDESRSPGGRKLIGKIGIWRTAKVLLHAIVGQMPENIRETHSIVWHNFCDRPYQQTLRLNPDYVLAHNNLGVALQEQGKFADAIASYQQALRLKPDFAEVYSNLGNALKKQGKPEEAIIQYRQALRLKPDHPLVHFNLGFALQEQEKFDEAIIHYQQALRLKPDYAEACSNLGLALKEQGKVDEAIAHFQQALRLKPDYAPAYNNLGNVFQEQGNLDEAVTHYQQALRLKPDFVEAYNNLGSTLQEQGKLTEAIGHRRQALRLKPEDAAAHSNLVFCLQYHPDYDAVAIYQEARRWNDQHAEALVKFSQPRANRPDPNRRLRIGYVSPLLPRSLPVILYDSPAVQPRSRPRGDILLCRRCSA